MAVPLTRYSAEVTLLARCLPTMVFARLVPAGTGATNGTPLAALNDPIASALEELGALPNDRTNVVDADVGILAGNAQSRFLDLTEIRLMETCLNAVMTQGGSQQWVMYKIQNLSMTKDLTDRIEAMRKRYLARYAQSGAPVMGSTPNVLRGELFLPRPEFPFGLF